MRWSRKYEKCKGLHHNSEDDTLEHMAKGLCRNCYQRQFMKKQTGKGLFLKVQPRFNKVDYNNETPGSKMFEEALKYFPHFKDTDKGKIISKFNTFLTNNNFDEVIFKEYLYWFNRNHFSKDFIIWPQTLLNSGFVNKFNKESYILNNQKSKQVFISTPLPKSDRSAEEILKSLKSRS
jgi:hypothetical protein